jgi:hypothetical protein
MATGAGPTFVGKFDHNGSSYKVQVKAQGGGDVAVTDIGVRGLYWSG